MNEFTLERSYAAPPEKVFAHFTEPELMEQWFCPNPALATSCTLDVRPGGAWRCAMEGYVVSGSYVEVVPPSRLVFTWSWDHDDDPATVVTVRFEPDGAGTRVVLEHAETAPDVGRDGHEGGWAITLGRLGELLG